MKKIILIIFILVISLSYKEEKVVNNNINSKYIALTFDDGPNNKTTPRLLDELKKRNIQATFFVLGLQAEKYPEITRRIVNEGHTIGNHTYNHYNLSRLSFLETQNELQKTSDVIFSITSIYPKYYRPSYGSIKKNQINKINLKLIRWTLDSKDWRYQNTPRIVKKVLNEVDGNEIILMHDIYDTSVDAAIEIIDKLTVQGYKFVTIDKYLQVST